MKYEHDTLFLLTSDDVTSLGACTEHAAAVCRAAGEPLTIEEIVVDPPKAYEIRIRVVCTSLCHTDITFWKAKVHHAVPSFQLSPALSSRCLRGCLLPLPAWVGCWVLLQTLISSFFFFLIFSL